MGGFFNYDSPLLSGLGKLADLIILNLLTMIFCIPIVTIGASLTACHYAALKIKRGEGYVIKNFWKSFRENFVQSTAIALIVSSGLGISLYVVLFSNVEGTMASASRGVLFAASVFWGFIGCWVFPLQSKFANTVKNTIKNSFLLSFRYLFRTILMLLINLLPIVMLFLGYQWYSLLIMFGFSAPIYLCALLYDKKFEELEEMIMQSQAEEVEEAEEIFTMEEGAN